MPWLWSALRIRHWTFILITILVIALSESDTAHWLVFRRNKFSCLLVANIEYILLVLFFSAFLTRNVFGPADDHNQLAVSEVTQSGESPLGRVGLQRVRHGKQLFWLCHQEMGHDEIGGACITKHKTTA